MKIAFTGHRNAETTPAALEKIAAKYPGAVWVHGGAEGFDSQVEAFAESRDIPTEIIRPDYKTHGRPAPLIRNREIVSRADVLFACYDGRKGGGTDYTAKHAISAGKVVVFLPCIIDKGRQVIPGEAGW
jgi:hypothetical protein